MDDLLGAITASVPALINTHGPMFFVLLLSVAANVVLYRDNKALNKQVNDEIKAGVETANGFKDAFIMAAEAMKNVRRSR